MDWEKEFEEEKCKKALYRKDGSDYHTLKFVRWLKTKLDQKQSELDSAIEVMKQYQYINIIQYEIQIDPFTRQTKHDDFIKPIRDWLNQFDKARKDKGQKQFTKWSKEGE